MLVLISDGEHDPAPGSPFPAKGIGRSKAWQDLATRAAALKGVNAYALPLAGNPGGAEALGYVFPTPQTLVVKSADDVAAALEQPREVVRRDKARELLRPDAAAGFEIVARATPAPPSGRSTTWEITVRSRSRYVPYTLSKLALTAAGGPVIEAGDLPPSIRLEPGGTVTLRPRVSIRSDRPLPDRLGLTLQGSAGTEWSAALAELAVPPTITVSQPLGTVSLARGAAAASVRADGNSGDELPVAVQGLLFGVGILLIGGGVAAALLLTRRLGRPPEAR